MQLLRAKLFNQFEFATPRPKHSQQREALPLPIVRQVLRPADQLGQTFAKARKRRTHHFGRTRASSKVLSRYKSLNDYIFQCNENSKNGTHMLFCFAETFQNAFVAFVLKFLCYFWSFFCRHLSIFGQFCAIFGQFHVIFGQFCVIFGQFH